MKITVEQLEDLTFEGGLDLEDGTGLSVVEEGEWEQDSKMQSKEVIFTDGSKYYRGYIGRSGSPFTDWTYDSEIYGEDELADIVEVVEKEITVTKWVTVL